MIDTYSLAILGNFNEKYGPHIRMTECLQDIREPIRVSVEWVPTEYLTGNATLVLKKYDGIIAGSGPYKSKEGVINGIRYARTNNIPFLGTCSGFAYAVLEFAQSLFHLDTVYHPYEGVALPEKETFLQCLNECKAEMHPIHFSPLSHTLTGRIYEDRPVIREQSHCTYGIHLQTVDAFEKAGMIGAACDANGEIKMMEYNRNDFFIITLFLPQFNYESGLPHPLFSGLYKAMQVSTKKQA